MKIAEEGYPLITVQILNWNRAEETLRAIHSVNRQTYPNIEIVVVDNGSEDNSIELIKKLYPEVRLLELNKNFGCPGGRNRGIPFCKGKFIFFLDNDGVLHEDAVLNAYISICSEENVGIVTGTIYDFNDSEEISVDCDFRSIRRYFYNIFQGGITLHDIRIYEEVGLYPDHFIYGQEETYLSLKLHDTDFKILKDETVVLWHKRSDLARNREKEILNGILNKLYISIALYPLFYMILYHFYFMIKYPFYCLRTGIFLPLLKIVLSRYIPTCRLAIKNRKPVSYNAYRTYNSACLMQ